MKKLTSYCLLALFLSMPVYAEQEVNPPKEPISTAVDSEPVDSDEAEQVVDIDSLEAESNLQEAVADSSLPQDLSPWGMYQSADNVVKAVMILLLLASIATWSVWAFKTVQMRLTRRRAQLALQQLVAAKSLADANAASGAFKGASLALLDATNLELALSENTSADGIKERLGARLDRVHDSAAQASQKGVSVLATTGAVAPFVGLFGTVWGIMGSFIGIAESQTTNLAVVAPGIAEALLATAMGLVAAIPAVVFYNHFSKAVSAYRGNLSDVVASLLILVSRDLEQNASSADNES